MKNADDRIILSFDPGSHIKRAVYLAKFLVSGGVREIQLQRVADIEPADGPVDPFLLDGQKVACRNFLGPAQLGRYEPVTQSARLQPALQKRTVLSGLFLISDRIRVQMHVVRVP